MNDFFDLNREFRVLGILEKGSFAFFGTAQ